MVRNSQPWGGTMKNLLLLSLVVLTSACGIRKASDEVKERVAAEKASGAWDRRPEVALNNKLIYKQVGSCETNNLAFNGVTVVVPATQAKPAYLVNIYLNADHSYKALWFAALSDQPGHWDTSNPTTTDGAWNVTTTWSVMIRKLGTAQFDANMDKGTVTFEAASVASLTDAPTAPITIENQHNNIVGRSADDICKGN